MKTFKLAGSQGEVSARRIKELPDADTLGLVPVRPQNGFIVVAHSESGHHHGFHEAEGVTVLEQTKGLSAGMQVFYAILENPTDMVQNATAPHETLRFDAGIFRLPIAREYDPFAEQARRVAD